MVCELLPDVWCLKSRVYFFASGSYTLSAASGAAERDTPYTTIWPTARRCRCTPGAVGAGSGRCGRRD